MTGMFSQAAAFNQRIGSWNVANVTYMYDVLDGSVYQYAKPAMK